MGKIERTALETFISKYHLGGLIEQVAWNYDGKKLSTEFIYESRVLLGNLTWSGFKHTDSFDLGIYSTSTLSKMLGVLDNVVSMQVNSREKEATSVDFSDGDVSIKYILSKLSVLPQIPKKTKFPEFDVSIVVNETFIDRFIRACNALSDATTFAVESTAKETRIVLGYTSVQSNNIIFKVETKDSKPIEKITFSAPLFKAVLAANKSATETVLQISEEGLAKMVFKEDTYTGTYYIVRVEEPNMHFSEYQILARKTALYPNQGENYVYPTLGLSGESGEVADKIKKIIRDDDGIVTKEKQEELVKELGDVLWYVSNLCSELGINLDMVADTNIQKLFKRKEEGKIKGSGDNR